MRVDAKYIRWALFTANVLWTLTVLDPEYNTTVITTTEKRQATAAQISTYST